MYYPREIEKKIERYLDTPEIIAIFGPRQVGKTTLVKVLFEFLYK
jgi:predicted AAA+ superfamily ATPase